MAWADASADGVHEADISFLSGDVVFISVRATDSAGLSTLKVSAPLFIDDTPPLVVRSASLVNSATGRSTAYWGLTNLVHASFSLKDPHTGVVSVFMSVLGASELPPAIATMSEFPRSYRSGGELTVSAPLQHGSSYQLFVCAVDRVQLSSCSPPFVFVVDLTPPSCSAPVDRFGGVSTQGNYFGQPGAISASWDCTDDESSVSRSEWSVVSQDGAVKRVLPEGSGSATLTMPMVGGRTYNSCVRAANRAGQWSSAVCSLGKTYDPTPPSAGQLTDGNGRQFQDTIGVPCAFWAGVVDAESGISAISLSLMRVDGDAESEVGGASAVSGTLADSGILCRSSQSQLEQGGSYYSRLTVTNGAGVIDESTSAGFTVDITAPVPGSVHLMPVYPPRFEQQHTFPSSVAGLRLRVRLSGFEVPHLESNKRSRSQLTKLAGPTRPIT